MKANMNQQHQVIVSKHRIEPFDVCFCNCYQLITMGEIIKQLILFVGRPHPEH